MDWKKNTVLISIILPLFHTEVNKLKRCLNSIQTQTYQNYEIIIVDDGSNEDYALEIDELGRNYSHIFIYHKKNEGVSVARNFGTEKATGDYVIYVDGDDLLPSTRLEHAIQAVLLTSADVFIGKVLQINSYDEAENASFSTAWLPGSYMVLSDKDKSDFICQVFTKHVRNWGCDENRCLFNGEGCWSYMLKREVALLNPFPPGISVGEDTVWAVTLLKYDKLKVCLIDELWYYYVQNSESVLHRYNPRLAQEIGKAVIVLNGFFLNEEGTEKNAYLEWIQYKQKQIIHMCYLNKASQKSKIALLIEYAKENGSSPWKEILCLGFNRSIITNLKFLAYRSGLMLLIQLFKGL